MFQTLETLIYRAIPKTTGFFFKWLAILCVAPVIIAVGIYWGLFRMITNAETRQRAFAIIKSAKTI